MKTKRLTLSRRQLTYYAGPDREHCGFGDFSFPATAEDLCRAAGVTQEVYAKICNEWHSLSSCDQEEYHEIGFYFVEAIVNSMDFDVGDLLSEGQCRAAVDSDEFTVRFVKPGRS